MWRVTITRGVKEQTFDVSLRMADAADAMMPEKPRSLEVRVKEPSGEFEEEALLRVSDRRDKGGEFEVQEGWILSQGEIFPFEPKGDRAPLELGLVKLGKKPALSLLTIHDVLALLFGAELKDAGAVGGLRGEVSKLLTINGIKRDYKISTVKLRNLDEVLAEVWFLVPKTLGPLPKTPHVTLDYEISRSPEYPFDFIAITFNLKSEEKGTFGLISNLVPSATAKYGAPSPLSFTAAAAPACKSPPPAASKQSKWRKIGGSGGARRRTHGGNGLSSAASLRMVLSCSCADRMHASFAGRRDSPPLPVPESAPGRSKVD